MKTRIVSLLLASLCCSQVQSASETLIWGNAAEQLKKYNLELNGTNQSLIQLQTSNYQLKAVDIDNLRKSEHSRYAIYYKNIPVWGREITIHRGLNSKPLVTGIDVSGIENDIVNMTPRLSPKDVLDKTLGLVNDKIIYKQIDQIVYLNSSSKAQLAYHVFAYTNSETSFVAQPNYIVDANTGETLKFWDGLTHKRIGQGLGGNVFLLPYRSGVFQHGDVHKDIPSLGKFDVRIKGANSFVESPSVKVINASLIDLDQRSFPILSVVEFFKNIPTFSYPCSKETGYVNVNDGDTSPNNYSFSSINDSMYFAGITLDMYSLNYGIPNPLGDDLPLRTYTHIKNFDNAFAVPSIKVKGIYIMHQQIVIGDGNTKMTAPAQGTLAHELSHNFTRLHSNLVYQGQSGGINESFSDMASIALQDYLSQKYPWYWDGKDWSIGREATIGAEPIRYMDHPYMDGRSIENAKDYDDKLDVHQTSGVFNRAFYLLANRPNWTVKKAFEVMIDANMHYWTSETGFEAAACGVIQAAIDRKYDKMAVVDAFKEVGVNCPVNKLYRS
ncbi:M4 family metallopeptidase [Legionella waltersii]|uniref:Neutral metalloproteinase n=1 Tax=Legionella waltersii TaxID=66969 RepID=A0A0W1A1A3_9GAMM|nr:M4 family metallopeptidase [Legionella waltersii]KTD75143.1 class 4 metalloprotease [Legionella waltersii]SNV04842.1 zinc metalloprotease [Legionella waltersii]